MSLFIIKLYNFNSCVFKQNLIVLFSTFSEEIRLSIIIHKQLQQSFRVTIIYLSFKT